MKLRKRSPISGKTNEIDLPISEEDFAVAELRWKRGAYIQDAFPTLSQNQREFIKTGITPSEWDVMFPSEDKTDEFGAQNS